MDSEGTSDKKDEKSPIPGFSSINEFSQQSLKAVLQAIKSSNELPVGADYDFYSTFSTVRNVLDMEGQRILALLQRILRHQNVKGNVGPGASMELEERFDILMDVNDQILERAGTLLDEASGLRKQEAKLVLATTAKPKVSTSWNKKVDSPTKTMKAATAYRLLTARNIQRPQLRFKNKIDNSNNPFKPAIKAKPNALKSLEDSLRLPDNVTMEDTALPDFVYPHPYAFELEKFFIGPDLLTKVIPQEPLPVSSTPLIHVDKTDQLRNLLEDLKQQKEIAIDLEHHSYRSFQGFTCLMQISTRANDYIIDTIDLRDELYILNEVFTNPKITKIFHGADSDIKWLQKDLGIYVVNMFDTGQAARVLNMSRFSLAHVLMHYCRVEADKQFQLADWRIRPLPEELINYAREDTHYLLYIYDLMKNQLLDSGNDQANLLQSVFTRSKLVASQVYCKPTYKDTEYLELYNKSRKLFNNQQLAALKDLYRWRDTMARMEDESLGYVLPNHMLLQIAEILPREAQGILACCNPIPPLVRQNLPELHKMILQAREITLAKVEKTIGPQPSLAQHPKYNSDSLLNCRHDMTRQGEMIADVEKDIAETGLIANTLTLFRDDKCDKLDCQIKKLPQISAFSPCQENQVSVNKTNTKATANKIRSLFTNPFTKFLATDSNSLVKPENKDVWILKSSTNKRKPDLEKDTDKDKVDLDSFTPEYAPPSKKRKVTINLTSSSSNPSAGTGGNAKSKSIFGIPDDGSEAAKSVKGVIKNEITSKLQTLRDEVTKAKKKMKEMKEKKSKDKSKSKKNGNNTDVKPPESQIIQNNKKNQEDKKNKKNESSSNENTSQDKKNKKKKKKEDHENFKGFDYEAAEKQLKKEASEAKKPDIYNPRLPQWDNKKKGRKGKDDMFKGKKKKGNSDGDK